MKSETLLENNYYFRGKECVAQFLKALVFVFTDENNYIQGVIQIY